MLGLRPDVYHGRKRRPPFFEGWYFKLVDREELTRLAIIPGVFLHMDPEIQHAFIQVLDGTSATSQYIRYPYQDFHSSHTSFELRIADNVIKQSSMTLQITQNDFSCQGTISFRDPKPWPVSLISPGIMGWYAWVPFMECYHGVLSLDHELDGTLTINGRQTDFSGGRGYIEKDWGKSFPHAHIWMQSNHFPTPGTSLTASVAIIPWIRSSFPGFIVGLLLEGRLYQFATYTGATIAHLAVDDNQVRWSIRDRKHELTLVAKRSLGGRLHAPTESEMTNRLLESLTSTIEVTLASIDGKVLFRETGRNAGVELGGAIGELISLWRSDQHSPS